jgi:magnesium-transporting ATPase (P-type)
MATCYTSRMNYAETGTRLPVARRTRLLGATTFVGAVFFVPFLMAQSPDTSVIITAPLFILISTMITTLAGIYGFRLNDKLKLPLPLLRPFERRQHIDRAIARKALIIGVITGIVVGLGTFLIANIANASTTNPGSLVDRLLSFVWASTVLETIGHLFILTLILRFVRSKWLAIIVSGVGITLLFHSGNGSSTDSEVLILGLNLLGFTATGCLYLWYGLESAVIAHAVMHILLLGLN